MEQLEGWTWCFAKAQMEFDDELDALACEFKEKLLASLLVLRCIMASSFIGIQTPIRKIIPQAWRGKVTQLIVWRIIQLTYLTMISLTLASFDY